MSKRRQRPGNVLAVVVAAAASCTTLPADENIQDAYVSTVSPSSLDLEVGEEATVAATVESGIGDVLDVTFTTSNAAVATVTPMGARQAVVRGVTPGTATVEAELSNGNDGRTPAQVAVTVRTDFTVEVMPPSRTIAPNQTTTFSCVVRGPDGTPLTGRTVLWVSSNTNVASVTPFTGGVIVAGGQEGTAQITCTDVQSGATDSATVTVQAPMSP